MRYKVTLAQSAKDDLRESARWLSREASPVIAARWLTGLERAMNSLAEQPYRCPLALENDRFPFEIRELTYGRRRGNPYRILFTIDGDLIQILYVRHAARDEIEP